MLFFCLYHFAADYPTVLMVEVDLFPWNKMRLDSI